MATTKEIRKPYNGMRTEYLYTDLSNAPESTLLSFLRERGFELKQFRLVELHDMYDEFEEFCSSDYDEVLKEHPWSSIGGYWKVWGSFEGADVWLEEHDTGVGISLDSVNAKSVSPLITAFDEAFAPKRFELEDSVLVRCTDDSPKLEIGGCSAIGRDAFKNNKSLREVIVGKGVQTIGSCAFNNCSNLEYLRISKDVRELGDQALCGCDKLTTAGPSWDCSSKGSFATYRAHSRGGYRLEFDHVDELPARMCFNLKHLTSVEIPHGITAIGKECFFGCKQLREVTIPDTVNVIGEGAFMFCSALEKLAFSGDAASIDIADNAFDKCESLADENGFVVVGGVLYDFVGNGVHLTIPEGVTRIAAGAFRRTGVDRISRRHIESVVIPGSVKSIGVSAFADSERLRTVVLEEGLESIGNYAFHNCPLLEEPVIPKSMTSIGEGAFPPPRAKVPSPKPKPGSRSDDVLWTVVDNHSVDDQALLKLQKHSATYLSPSGQTYEGTLLIGGGLVRFNASTGRPGRPDVRFSCSSSDVAITLEGNLLKVVSKGVTHRFKIAESDLSELELRVLRLDSFQELKASYTSSIADSCAHGSWPGVEHPFFKTHVTDSASARAVLELLANDAHLKGFVFKPLPWHSMDVSVKQWKRGLLVTAKQGSGLFGYRETQDEIELSYYDHAVGFFDDSEYEVDLQRALHYIESPKKADRRTLLKDPCGMKGFFQLSG